MSASLRAKSYASEGVSECQEDTGVQAGQNLQCTRSSSHTKIPQIQRTFDNTSNIGTPPHWLDGAWSHAHISQGNGLWPQLQLMNMYL
jgi:hypothetical protein